MNTVKSHGARLMAHGSRLTAHGSRSHAPPPAPLCALIAAGHRALHGSAVPVPPLTGDDLAALPLYAMRHGMTAFLPHVRSETIDQVPAIRDELERVVHHHALAVLSGTTELLTILRHLARCGIEPVVLKGPALAAWLYGDAGMRRFIDVDLLVRRSLRIDAMRALEQLGFVRRIPDRAADAIYSRLGAWPMTREGGIGVDLHWQLSALRFPMPLTVEDVIAGAISIRIGDQAVCTAGPTDAAILALLHAAKHVWYALESTLAIAWLARRDDIDWPRAHRRLESAGAVRAAAAGLRLAADFFDTRVPAPFIDAVRSPAAEQLASMACGALALPPGTFVDRWLERRAHLAAFDRMRDRVRYDVRRLLEPTALEWTWLPLPRALTLLYGPLRIIRLAIAPISAPGQGPAARSRD
jgi:Uncharacterised nucleotidyltransferase